MSKRIGKKGEGKIRVYIHNLREGKPTGTWLKKIQGFWVGLFHCKSANTVKKNPPSHCGGGDFY